MRIAARSAIALGLALAGLPAQKRVLTHEDVFLMKRVGEPVPSPDGKWVVFSVTEPDYDPARTVTDLWLVPGDGSAAPRRLTNTRGGESGVAWSPDSRRIAFTARRDGDDASQVYLLSLDGGEALRVTTLATGANNPKFRPDGKAILFESTMKGAPMAPGKSSARVYDSFPVRYWNFYLDNSQPHIFVQELSEGAKPVDLLAGTRLAASPGFAGLFNPTGSDQQLQPVWSPDGREIVFTALVNRDETMYAENESQLFRIGAQGGEPAMITVRGASYGNPKFSADGKALYALHQRSPTPQRIYSLSRLAAFSWPNPGAVVLWTGKWDRSIGSFSVAPGSSAVYLEAEDDGFDRLFRLAAAGGVPQALLEVREGGYTAPLATPAGLYARFGASWQPPEIVRFDPERPAATLVRLTDFNKDRLAQLDLPKPEHFWFTARNGKRIHNLIQFPPALDRSRKYPLVIFPHGGPNSMSKDAFSTRWNNHLLTAPGYVLLQTNYTGSTGFGEKFADDIERDVLKGPAEETLEAIEEAAKRYPFLDLKRQAAVGASYGGYLMNWYNGRTNQFRCLVNHAGAVNNESQYGFNDGGITRELRMGAPVWAFGKGQWNAQSPIRYSQNWQTPSLVTQGELDFRVPLSESMTTYKILLRRKVPARLVIFPDEGHWILKGENSKHHMQEVLGWLKKYLEPAEPVWRP
jgi:dipeptidyl aminopeptidase/acylaminoacyl peptidase